MANEDTSSQTETTETSTVVVPALEPNQTLTVTINAEQVPQINFDPGTESTQEFVGTDLVFTLDNGAVLTFEDFAANVNNGEVTAIMLADGAVIPIDALMAAWNLDVPETAAGEAPAGGGASAYVDDMGNTLDGLNKLGVQDPDPFGTAAPQVLEDEQTLEIPVNEPPVAIDDLDEITELVDDITTPNYVEGNVLLNDTDADGDPAAFVVTNPGTYSGVYGDLELSADGSYKYTLRDGDDNVQSLQDGDTPTDTFSYDMDDGDGGTSSADLVITVNGANDSPTVNSLTAMVTEEGLVDINPLIDANDDTLGNPDQVNDATPLTATGTFTVTDVDNQTGDFTFSLSNPPASLTSGDVPLDWSTSSAQTLIGTSGLGGSEVIRISIDATSGDYTVLLSGPIDHATPGTEPGAEEQESFDVTVNVTDGLTPTTGTLTVVIEDDSPIISGTYDANIGNEAGNSLTATLGIFFGADGPIENGVVEALQITGINANDPVMSDTNVQLTADEVNLHYEYDANGDLLAVKDGVPASEYVAFRISLNATDGTYTVTLEDGMDGGPTTTTVGLTSNDGLTDSGGNINTIYAAFDFDNDGTNDSQISFTGQKYEQDTLSGGTVNFSVNGLGVSSGTTLDGTGFDQSDILTMEFTEIATGDYLNHFTSVNISTYKFDGAKGETGWWTAYVHEDDGNGGYTLVQVGETTQFWIGDLEGDEIVVKPGGVFDTVELRGAEGNGWAIDAITFTNDFEGADHTVTYNFQATDADYDTADGAFTVNFDGNDGLTAGEGLDALFGGAGVDVFNFTANGGEGSNEILDFDTAVDRLNFTDLLDGGDGLDPDEVTDFLTNVTYENNGTDLVLTVPDQNDPVGGEATQITLAGVGGEFDIGTGNLSQLVAEINVDTYSS